MSTVTILSNCRRSNAANRENKFIYKFISHSNNSTKQNSIQVYITHSPLPTFRLTIYHPFANISIHEINVEKAPSDWYENRSISQTIKILNIYH